MGQKPRFINIGFLRFRRFSSHVALHAFLSLLRRRAFRFDKESIPYITLSSQTSVPPAIPLSSLIAQKKEAAASAVFCKNNRLRLVTLFQFSHPSISSTCCMLLLHCKLYRAAVTGLTSELVIILLHQIFS